METLSRRWYSWQFIDRHVCGTVSLCLGSKPTPLLGMHAALVSSDIITVILSLVVEEKSALL